MDEEMKKWVAVFRFGVIADFVDGTTLSRGETKKLMREKCARQWQKPDQQIGHQGVDRQVQTLGK